MHKLQLDAVECNLNAATTNDKVPSVRIVAYNGAPMKVGGFQYPVVIDLSEPPKQSVEQVRLLLNHDQAQPVGHVTSLLLNESPRSLIAEGVLSVPSEFRDMVVSASKNDFRWQASVGGQFDVFDKFADGVEFEVNGRTWTGPAIVARDFRIHEISFVALGADTTTSVSIAAQAAKGITMSFDEWVASLGLPSGVSDDALAKLYEAYNKIMSKTIDETPAEAASQKSEVQPTPSATPQPQTAAAASSDARNLRAMLEEIRNEIKAASQKSKLEKNAPAVSGRASDAPASNEVYAAALCMSGKLGDKTLEASFDAKTLETAHRQFRGRLGIGQAILRAAQANGYIGGHDSIHTDLPGVLNAAFDVRANTAFSNISIAGILSNVANKFLLEAFNNVEQSWRNISQVRAVPDLKVSPAYRLVLSGQSTELPPDGVIQHGAFTEDSYSNQAKTYAQLVRVGRHRIINDDLDALSGVPRSLGAQTGKTFNRVFWTEFLRDVATRWTTGRGNYIEGATTALSIEGLRQAVAAFLQLKDSNGEFIAHEPRTLLVPPQLEGIARQLFVSTNLTQSGGSTAEQRGEANPYVNLYQPVTSRYLSDTTITGNSQTAFWLIGDATVAPVMDVVFLNGNQTPTVDTAEADFNTLGIQMRCFFDYGVAFFDHRGGVRSKGAA